MPILNLNGIPGATFDTDTRQLAINCSNSAYTGKIPTLPTIGEQVTAGFFLALEAANNAKRTDLDAVVSNGDAFSVPSPQYQFVIRTNADETANEMQLEYTLNLRLWFKDAGVIAATNAVNSSD